MYTKKKERRRRKDRKSGKKEFDEEKKRKEPSNSNKKPRITCKTLKHNKKNTKESCKFRHYTTTLHLKQRERSAVPTIEPGIHAHTHATILICASHIWTRTHLTNLRWFYFLKLDKKCSFLLAHKIQPLSDTLLKSWKITRTWQDFCSCHSTAIWILFVRFNAICMSLTFFTRFW